MQHPYTPNSHPTLQSSFAAIPTLPLTRHPVSPGVMHTPSLSPRSAVVMGLAGQRGLCLRPQLLSRPWQRLAIFRSLGLGPVLPSRSRHQSLICSILAVGRPVGGLLEATIGRPTEGTIDPRLIVSRTDLSCRKALRHTQVSLSQGIDEDDFIPKCIRVQCSPRTNSCGAR